MRGTPELHCKICRKSSGRLPEMIFRSQSGAGVGTQALSYKVWWCVPCWSGGREPWQVQSQRKRRKCGKPCGLFFWSGYSVCLRIFLVSWKYCMVEPPAVTGFSTRGILTFEVNDMEWCFGFSASKSLWHERTSLPAFCPSTLPMPPQLLEFIRL